MFIVVTSMLFPSISMRLNVFPKCALVLLHENVPAFTSNVLWTLTQYGTCLCPISTNGTLFCKTMAKVSPASSIIFVSLPELGTGIR